MTLGDEIMVHNPTVVQENDEHDVPSSILGTTGSLSASTVVWSLGCSCKPNSSHLINPHPHKSHMYQQVVTKMCLTPVQMLIKCGILTHKLATESAATVFLSDYKWSKKCGKNVKNALPKS